MEDIVAKVGEGVEFENASWNFGKNVVDSFEEHVKRSVPLYSEGHELILKMSDYFIKDDSIAYDIGCSAGLLTYRLAKYNQNKSAKVVGLDIESAMIKKATKKYKLSNLEYVNDDILAYDFSKTDFVVSYYTMQFISPNQRQILFDKIYDMLNWGGAFLLFEKVRAPDARFQDIMSSVYVDYKLEQGYKSNEIIAKSRSLKGVLEPFSTQGNIDLLKRAGFVDYMSIMKYVCFEGFLAIK
ncbi:MAG: methyltransferase domain-containing protein [Verrucomicrobiota bacterium]|nr:methyltransferase domain-containing protein [Verrucomicrobiota bacterium]